MSAPVVISYRGHQTEKDGEGMLFDHFRIQNLTNRPTVVSYPSTPFVHETAQSHFKLAIRQHMATLAYGDPYEGHRLPQGTLESHEGGLLVIPGRVHKIENEPFRLDHEYRVMRNALNRGQPILAICAGVWRLWNQLIISTRYPDAASAGGLMNEPRLDLLSTTITVTDHCYSSMIRLDQHGILPCNDKIIHLNDIVPDSHLQSMMSTRTSIVQVIEANSVHWKAVNPVIIMPDNVRISATSRTHPGVTSLTRHQKVFSPTEHSVEAFENIHGAPIMALQWHAEGCKSDKTSYIANRRVIVAMAQAGDAYFAKRIMLRQFAHMHPERY
jgi:gamma-glutamyl-gamma-aminobutyrate hydrolase PuuD